MSRKEVCAAITLAGILFGVGGIVNAAEIEVIYTKIATDASSVVPGALDLAGAPAATNFRALEDLYMSPDGSMWVVKGRTQQGSDLETILMLGSGLVGSMFAQEGQPVDGGVAGELYDFFGSGGGRFNDLNQFAYSARARGGVSTVAQKVIFWDGATFTLVTQQGDPYTGLVDNPPGSSGDELVGNSIGSIHPLNDGTIGAHDTTIQNIFSLNRPAIFYDNDMFHQKNVTQVPDLGGTPRLWSTLTSNSFYTSPDGAHWLTLGTLDTGSTADDSVLVVDGATVIQEGNAIPSSAVVASTIVTAQIASSGDWYARGAISGGGVYAVHNGVVVAKTGDPITTGSSENWGTTFLSFNGDSLGHWILVGSTDNADTAIDTVLVVDGATVLVREGDPVDLDGNGSFDDGVFIGRGNLTSSAFEVNDAYPTVDGYAYFFADIHDGAGNDLNSDPAFGTPQAFLRKALAASVQGDVDGDGDVDLQDLALLLAAYGTCVGDPGYNAAADIDGDGCVDLADLALLLANYGT